MTGLKPGDKVAVDFGVGLEVAKVVNMASNKTVIVARCDGRVIRERLDKVLTADKLISMAEEILGTQEDTLPEYVYITKGRNETGCAVPIGTKLKVIGEASGGPGGSLEVEGPSGENWWVEPAWYTTEEPEPKCDVKVGDWCVVKIDRADSSPLMKGDCVQVTDVDYATGGITCRLGPSDSTWCLSCDSYELKEVPF